MDVWRNAVHQKVLLDLFGTRTAKEYIRRIIDLSSRPKLIAAIVVCGSAGYAIRSLIHNGHQRRNLKLMFTTLKHHPIRSCVICCSEVLIPTIILLEAQDIYLSCHGRKMTKNNLYIILFLISVQLCITFVTGIQPRMCYIRFMDVSYLPLAAVGLLLGQFDHKQDASATMFMTAAINEFISNMYQSVRDFHFLSPTPKISIMLHSETLAIMKVHSETLAIMKVHSETLAIMKVQSETLAVMKVHSKALAVMKVHSKTLAVMKVHSRALTVITAKTVVMKVSDEDYNEMGENNFRNDEGSEGDRDVMGDNEHYDSGDDPNYVPGDHEHEESSENSDGDESTTDEEVQHLLFEQYGAQKGSSGEEEDLEKDEKSPEKEIGKDEQQDKMLLQTNQKKTPLVKDLQKGKGLPKANVQKIEIDFNVEQGRESILVVYEKNLEQKIVNFYKEDASKEEIFSEIVKKGDSESLEGAKDIYSSKVNVQTEDRSVDVKTDQSKSEKSFHKE